MIQKSLLITLAAVLVVAGCARQKEPAERAVASIESSLAAFKDDAEEFAKDQYDVVEAKIANLKARMEKKEYEQIVATAPEVTQEVAALKETVAAKKAEVTAARATATENWNPLQADVLSINSALQPRIDALAKRSKDNPSADALELNVIKTIMADAGNLFNLGKPVEAVARAEEAKARATALADKLRVKVTPAVANN